MKLIAGFSFAALALPASAQEVRCLLVEDGALPGVPGHTIDSISNTAVNQLGGYACTVNTTDGVATLSHVWGHATGGDGAPLRTEAVVGVYEQTSFETFFGVDDQGVAAYSPISTDTVGGGTGLDGVFLGDLPLAVEGEPIPTIPGGVWRYGSRPGVTRDGQPFWAGGIDDVAGANQGEGLFFGLSATPLYKTGDVPPGAPAAIDASGIDFDYVFSAYGTHHLTGVELGLASGVDYVVVMDGAALFAGGAIVQEGQPIPASVGGLPGETWGLFDFYGVNENGDYMITGDTGGDTATDEFVLKNGAILYREGDVLDGRVLTGAIESAWMNENGEIAFVWDVDDPVADLEALFFEGEIVLLEGDAVDVDANGDGILEPGARIADFTGIGAMTLGADRAMYFTADVDYLGTTSSLDDVECLFSARPQGTPDFLASPAQLSVGAGGTQAMFVRPGDAFTGQLYWIAGTVSGTTPGFAFGGFAIPLNPDFYFFITVEKPNVPPLVDTFAPLDDRGTGLAQWQLPAGLLPGAVGVTAHHAYLTLDPVTLSPSHVSTTTSLTFVP